MDFLHIIILICEIEMRKVQVTKAHSGVSVRASKSGEVRISCSPAQDINAQIIIKQVTIFLKKLSFFVIIINSNTNSIIITINDGISIPR